MSIPTTQINYLTISKETPIEDPESDAGRQWEAALDLLEGYQGFRRLYWGRSPENWSKVQLHVGESSPKTNPLHLGHHTLTQASQ